MRITSDEFIGKAQKIKNEFIMNNSDCNSFRHSWKIYLKVHSCNDLCVTASLFKLYFFSVINVRFLFMIVNLLRRDSMQSMHFTE